MYSLAADAIVVVHLLYVAYIVVGLWLIIAGLRRRWRWARNPWFRSTHLLAILIVVYELIVKANCVNDLGNATPSVGRTGRESIHLHGSSAVFHSVRQRAG